MHRDLTWQKTGLYVSEKSWVSSSESQRSRGSLSTHRHLECRFSSWLSWLTSIHCTISERSPCNKHQWDTESDSKAMLGPLMCQVHLVTLYCKLKMFVLYSIYHGYTLCSYPTESTALFVHVYFTFNWKKRASLCFYNIFHLIWKAGIREYLPSFTAVTYIARFFVCNVLLSAVSGSKRGETPAQRVI